MVMYIVFVARNIYILYQVAIYHQCGIHFVTKLNTHWCAGIKVLIKENELLPWKE